MAIHEPEQEATSAHDRLLAAALQMIFERGYRGATSREIARAAEVNEVTLFRLFSTKDDLLAAAIVQRAELDRGLVPPPSGCLEADLVVLANMAARVLAAGGQPLIRVLPEAARLPAKQRAMVNEALDATRAAFASVFDHYMARHEITTGLGDHLWMAFMGPVLIAALHAESRQVPLEFDASQHVQLFLDGCRARPR